MPETITPPPSPAPGEIRLGDIVPRHGRTEMPSSILEEARKLSGEPLPDPSPAPTPAAASSSSSTPPTPPTPEPPKTPEPTKPAKKKEGIEALREAFERQSAKVEELSGSLTTTSKEKADAYAKLAELEAKLTQANERISKDLEPRVQRLTEVEKKLQEREEILRVKDYTATQEWHDKYVKPIAEVQQEANELLSELRANVNGDEVPATQEHLNFVMAAPSLNEAARRAEGLFGSLVAPQIVNLRARLIGLQRKQAEALKTAQIEAVEYEKRSHAQAAQSREAVRTRLLTEAQRIIQADPDLNPGEDVELGSALAEGQKFADLLLNGSPELTTEQMVDKIAEGRARIIKSHVQEKRMAKMKTELESLREQLKQYQKSEPSVETRTGGSSPLLKGNEDARAKLLQAAMKLATT